MRKLTAALVFLASMPLAAQTLTPLDRAKQLQNDINQLVASLTPAAPPPSMVVNVAAGGDLQAAIDAATPGTTITLAAGATYTGTFTLKAKTGSGVITITSAGAIPPGRMTPENAVPLAKIVSGTTTPAIKTQAAAANYALVGLEVRAGLGLYPFGLIAIGAGDETQTTLAQVPTHVVIDRCYIHGDPTTGAKRGIDMNGADITVSNSWISDIKGKGQDTQALGGVNGPGPFTIVNNELDAAGENVLFGGADPAIPNLIPSDIVISGNTLSKPLEWRTQGWSVKNVLELKNAQRVHIVNNLLEHSWLDGQTGFLLMITVRDQSGHCPWCTVRDVEIDHNVLRHGNQGINVLGLDDTKDATGAIRASTRASGINIHDDLIYDIGGSAWGGGTTVGAIVNNGPINLTFSHLTFVGQTSELLALSLGASKTPAANLQFVCNIVNEGHYGIAGSTTVGLPSWTAGVDAASAFTDNAILPVVTVPGGPRKIAYPAGNRLAAYTFSSAYAITPPLTCADGKPAGVDVSALLAAMPGLDLSK
jgi:hypothetical protein